MLPFTFKYLLQNIALIAKHFKAIVMIWCKSLVTGQCVKELQNLLPLCLQNLQLSCGFFFNRFFIKSRVKSSTYCTWMLVSAFSSRMSCFQTLQPTQPVPSILSHRLELAEGPSLLSRGDVFVMSKANLAMSLTHKMPCHYPGLLSCPEKWPPPSPSKSQRHTALKQAIWLNSWLQTKMSIWDSPISLHLAHIPLNLSHLWACSDVW